jgi:hypothetical protein
VFNITVSYTDGREAKKLNLIANVTLIAVSKILIGTMLSLAELAGEGFPHQSVSILTHLALSIVVITLLAVLEATGFASLYFGLIVMAHIFSIRTLETGVFLQTNLAVRHIAGRRDLTNRVHLNSNTTVIS